MNILVCTDGSEESSKAVGRAAEISSAVEDAEVTLLHVHQPIQIPPPYGAGYTPVAVPAHINEKVRDAGKKILEEAAKNLEENKVRYRTLLLEGHPASMILEQADEEDCDLLVLGNKGRTGLQRVFMGSVSNAVVQEANCDVLVVKGG